MSAEIYKTIDESGRVVFTDKLTIEAKETDVDANINNADSNSDSAATLLKYWRGSPHQSCLQHDSSSHSNGHSLQRRGNSFHEGALRLSQG